MNLDPKLVVWLDDGLTDEIEAWLAEQVGKRAGNWFTVTEDRPVFEPYSYEGSRYVMARPALKRGIAFHDPNHALLAKLTWGGR